MKQIFTSGIRKLMISFLNLAEKLTMRSLRKTTESYVAQVQAKYPNKYDYSLVEYKGCAVPIKIICPKHGIFVQKPFAHLSKNGCPSCAKETPNNKSNTEQFVQKASIVHNNFFNYNKVDYKGAKEFVVITCPVHGDFQQRPNYHLSGNGCIQCYQDNKGFGRRNFVVSCKNGIGLLYLIKCASGEESFYKIGITSQTVKKRFKKFKRFPYSYEIIYTKTARAEDIYNLEDQLLRKYKAFRYIPLLPCEGYTECFKFPQNIVDNDFK